MRYILLLLFAYQSHAQLADFNDLDFKKADSIAVSFKNESLDNLPELAYKLTSNLPTEAERFRAIFKWVCINIANDYGLYFKNNRKRKKFKDDSLKLEEWNDRFKKVIFKKLLKRKKTICTGYAYIVKELSELAGLDCKIVHGFGRTSTVFIEAYDLPNHSWNAIKLNNKWYLCDPTWASGIPNPKTHSFSFEFNDGYFLADPKLFSINHYPLETRWLLLEETTSFLQFLKRPIIYGKAYNHLRSHDEPKQMHHAIKKNEAITFEYELKKTINTNKVSFSIHNGYSLKKILPTSVEIKNQFLTIKQLFDTKGFYDVHLYFGEDLISTYTIDVK